MAEVFGLDIGTATLKLAKISGSSSELSLDSVAVAPAPTPGILSESPIDLEKVADVVKQMMQDAEVSQRSVNIALAESQVFEKIIEMPKLTERELSAALAYEMDQYVPLPLDQVRTDWQILSEGESDGKITNNVLLIASSLSAINKYEKILQFADLKIESIETEVLSVQRALEPLIKSFPACILLHIGASTTDVAIVRSGVLSLMHTIGLGGLAITRGIAADTGVQIDDTKNDYLQSVPKDSISYSGRVLSPILESIIGDIRKVILSYKNKHNTDDITHIILSGDSALLPGLDGHFQKSLSKEAILANPWEARSIQNVPDQLLKEPARYPVVVGLALRDLL